jgi:hypothetical protein
MGTLAEATKKQCAITDYNARGDAPLTDADEKDRAKKLNERQRDQEICHSAHRAGHDGRDTVKLATLLTLLMAAKRQILQPAKAQAN